MIKKTLLGIFVVSLLAFSFRSQTVMVESAGNFCDPDTNQRYNPLKAGTVKSFMVDFSPYEMVTLPDTVEIKGKKYLMEVSRYRTDSTVNFLRFDKGNTYHIKKDQSKESLVFPAVPIAGKVWYEYDSSWKYTITKVNTTFKTPGCSFKNAVEIRAENMNPKKNQGYFLMYLNYYQKGKGYIGTNVGGFTYSYLTGSDTLKKVQEEFIINNEEK